MIGYYTEFCNCGGIGVFQSIYYTEQSQCYSPSHPSETPVQTFSRTNRVGTVVVRFAKRVILYICV